MKCLDAEKALPTVLPRVWEYCERHRAAGRSWHFCYAYKLLELWHLLNAIQPKRILELGTGCTTAVFAEYSTESGAIVVTVDENDKWQQAICDDLGSKCVKFLKRQAKWIGSSAVCYDPMPPINACDFLYVDGPANRKGDHEAICLDASPATACDDIQTIVFDIRRKTVEYTMHFKPPYDWQLSSWQEAGLPWYLSGFRHHTVARRRR